MTNRNRDAEWEAPSAIELYEREIRRRDDLTRAAIRELARGRGTSWQRASRALEILGFPKRAAKLDHRALAWDYAELRTQPRAVLRRTHGADAPKRVLASSVADLRKALRRRSAFTLSELEVPASPLEHGAALALVAAWHESKPSYCLKVLQQERRRCRVAAEEHRPPAHSDRFDGWWEAAELARLLSDLPHNRGA